MRLEELNPILLREVIVKMKKVVLEMVLEGLNQLEETSSTTPQEFQLTKSDANYLQKHLYNYHINVQEHGKLYTVKISKETA